MKKNKESILYALVVILLFVLVFRLNHWMPYSGEDYGLKMPYNLQNTDVGDRFLYAIQRSFIQIRDWNCRIGEQIAIFFLAFNKTYFDFFNSFVFLGLISILLKIADTKKEFRIAGTILIFSFIIILCPVMGDVLFWLTGATNYLWGITLLLLFFVYYWEMVYDPLIEHSSFFCIYIFLLGIFSGLTNENTVPAILFMIGGIFFYRWRVRVKQLIPLWSICGGIGILLGYLFLIFAPSTQHRIAFYKQTLKVPDPSLGLYLERLLQTGKMVFICNGYIMLIVAILLVITIVLWRQRSFQASQVQRILWSIFFCGSAHISIGLLVFSPYLEKRAFVFAFFANALLAFVLGREIFIAKVSWRKIIGVLSVSVLLIAGYILHGMLLSYSHYSQEAKQRQILIEQAIHTGKKEVAVPAYSSQDSRSLTTRDSWLINNIQYPLYYGIDKIEIGKSN